MCGYRDGAAFRDVTEPSEDEARCVGSRDGGGSDDGSDLPRLVAQHRDDPRGVRVTRATEKDMHRR